MDYLARREHSRHQLEKKLTLKQYTADEIAAALNRLIEQDLQSDLRFCRSFIEHRYQHGYGPLRIEQDLVQSGIDRAIIADGLQAYQLRWSDGLFELAQRKFSGPALDAKTYQKRYRFLLNRGFLPEQIREVLRDGNFNLE